MIDDQGQVRSLADAGQSFFAGRVAALDDAAFAGASGLPGWTRAHVVAHVALNAFALGNLAEWATTGVETPAYPSPAARDADIELHAHWSPAELRQLTARSGEHIVAAWSRVPDWSVLVRNSQGRELPVGETVWLRTRELWIHAVDLADGTRFTDAPPEFLDGLLHDIRSTWAKNGVALTLEATDRGDAAGDVRGTAADLAAWATGRPGGAVVGATAETPAWM